MLRSVKDLYGYKISALDHDIGKVDDVYFDDHAWTTRYLVADTRRWLPGRKVLIPRPVLGRPDWEGRRLPVELSRDQIKNGPPISEAQPVSRQHEMELHKYFQIDPYWARVPGGSFAVKKAVKASGETSGDPHLRSTREVIGYHIEASDGAVGHVEDLIIDDEIWSIRYLIVDTKNVLPGKKVLIPVTWADDISWDKSKVSVDITRGEIKDSPEYVPAAPVNRAYEERLYDYHGRPYDWP